MKTIVASFLKRNTYVASEKFYCRSAAHGHIFNISSNKKGMT
jgi:hypothetical protein